MGAPGNDFAAARKRADDLSRPAAKVLVICLSYLIYTAMFSCVGATTVGNDFAAATTSRVMQLIVDHAAGYEAVHVCIGDTGIVRNEKNGRAAASAGAATATQQINHSPFRRWPRAQRRLLTQICARMPGMFLKIVAKTIDSLEQGMKACQPRKRVRGAC